MHTVIVDATYLFSEQYAPSPHNINTSIVEKKTQEINEGNTMDGMYAGPVECCGTGGGSLTADRRGDECWAGQWVVKWMLSLLLRITIKVIPYTCNSTEPLKSHQVIFLAFYAHKKSTRSHK